MNAAALPAQNGLPPGTRLAEFEVQEVLGAGGFGVVYRAYDHSLHRTVAIKEYMPRGLAGRAGQAVVQGGTADAAVFDAGLRAFMAEARTLARFDHPSLVKVFRVWEGNRTAYMAMPFYEGLTLKAACAQMRQPPPEAWLRRLLWPLLQALELLHRQS
ncbi:MAG TPA: protein kinase, partial [Pseudorhodoferax sp.]|nr:protein kinase [Pseudorhodoferax sp.]